MSASAVRLYNSGQYASAGAAFASSASQSAQSLSASASASASAALVSADFEALPALASLADGHLCRYLASVEGGGAPAASGPFDGDDMLVSCGFVSASDPSRQDPQSLLSSALSSFDLYVSALSSAAARWKAAPFSGVLGGDRSSVAGAFLSAGATKCHLLLRRSPSDFAGARSALAAALREAKDVYEPGPAAFGGGATFPLTVPELVSFLSSKFGADERPSHSLGVLLSYLFVVSLSRPPSSEAAADSPLFCMDALAPDCRRCIDESVPSVSFLQSLASQQQRPRGGASLPSLSPGLVGVACAKVSTFFRAHALLAALSRIPAPSSPSSPLPSSLCLEVSRVLESLSPLSESDAHASHLLGCLHYSLRDVRSALSSFHQSLSQLSSGGGAPGDPSRLHLTVAHLAVCYAELGMPEPAVELLLHVLGGGAAEGVGGRRPAAAADNGGKATDSCGPLFELSGAGDFYAAEGKAPSRPADQSRQALLWRLYSCACSSGDWVTARSAADELASAGKNGENGGDDPAVRCARAYALLEARRPTLAADALGGVGDCGKRDDDDDDGPFKFARLSYQADATVCSEAGLKGEEGAEGAARVLSLCREAIRAFSAGASSSEKHQDPALRSAHRVVECSLRNNEGVALVMCGKETDAVVAFRSAIEAGLVPGACTTAAALVPQFNLAALLLSGGGTAPAVRVWLPARGLGAALDLVDGGEEHRAVDMYIRALGEAAQRYGASKAAISEGGLVGQQGGMGAVQIRTQRKQSPVDEGQIAAMDVAILNLAMQLAGSKRLAREKKASEGSGGGARKYS